MTGRRGRLAAAQLSSVSAGTLRCKRLGRRFGRGLPSSAEESCTAHPVPGAADLSHFCCIRKPPERSRTPGVTPATRSRAPEAPIGSRGLSARRSLMRGRPARRIVARRAIRHESPITMAVQRLHRSRDIRAVFAARNVAHGRFASLHGRSAGERECSRVAVTASRHVGNAVQRNRAKRRLRAAAHGVDFPAGLDLVIRAKAQAIDAEFVLLGDELARLARRVARRSGRVDGNGAR